MTRKVVNFDAVKDKNLLVNEGNLLIVKEKGEFVTKYMQGNPSLVRKAKKVVEEKVVEVKRKKKNSFDSDSEYEKIKEEAVVVNTVDKSVEKDRFKSKSKEK